MVCSPIHWSTRFFLLCLVAGIENGADLSAVALLSKPGKNGFPAHFSVPHFYVEGWGAFHEFRILHLDPTKEKIKASSFYSVLNDSTERWCRFLFCFFSVPPGCALFFFCVYVIDGVYLSVFIPEPADIYTDFGKINLKLDRHFALRNAFNRKLPFSYFFHVSLYLLWPYVIGSPRTDRAPSRNNRLLEGPTLGLLRAVALGGEVHSITESTLRFELLVLHLEVPFCGIWQYHWERFFQVIGKWHPFAASWRRRHCGYDSGIWRWGSCIGDPPRVHELIVVPLSISREGRAEAARPGWSFSVPASSSGTRTRSPLTSRPRPYSTFEQWKKRLFFKSLSTFVAPFLWSNLPGGFC